MTAAPLPPGQDGAVTHPPHGAWWRDCVGYQVYLRSFADGDGDGHGDLQGLLERLDYLEWLGVNLLWLSPFYPSPGLDHGYDVADYTDVDPVFGDLETLDTLFARCRERGMRVLVDLVPNHSSSEHRWFRESRSSRDNPYRDYYIWRDPAPGGGRPNNWVSHFGGPAWTHDAGTGQYWCHLFLPEQPDLNWANPEVVEEFDAILRFWLERGADGFRIDVAHALVKDQAFPDLPPARAPQPHAGPSGHLLSTFEQFEHVYDTNLPGVLDVYRHWREVVGPLGGMLLGEVYLLEAEALAPYLVDDDGLHLSFWFAPVHTGWDPDLLRAELADGAAVAPGSIAWIQGSHDVHRAVSRFGGGEAGRRRALALATLMIGMPGVPFYYQGEELGLEDGVVPLERMQDPIAVRAGDLAMSRDPARTPMPWDPGPGLGFTTAPDAWLPLGGRCEADTVAVQRADPGSWLHRHRALIRLRTQTPDLHVATLVWLTSSGPVLAYRRGGTVVAANLGEHAVQWRPPEGEWTLAFHSRGPDAADDGVLRACDALILQRP